MNVLLITQNAAGLFEDLAANVPPWVKALAALVRRKEADFVTLHMQEIGGTAYKKGLGVAAAAEVVKALVAEFGGEYWDSGLLLNADVDNDFSALGSIYLVRRTRLAEVKVWQMEGGGGWTALGEESLTAPEPFALPRRICRHARFTDDAFPVIASWSRKGYLHTRWLVGGTPLELVNVHLFHEDSNLTSLKRAAEHSGLSPFAHHRIAALRDIVLGGVRRSAAAGEPAGGVFLFGDFNFRLDQRKVIAHVCGEAGLAAAEKATPEEARQPRRRCRRRRRRRRRQRRRRRWQQQQQQQEAEDGGARPRCEDVCARVGEELVAQHEVLRGFDAEPACLASTGADDMRLYEQPVAFAPTYPMEPPAAKSPSKYSSKRCPAGRTVCSTTASAGRHSRRPPRRRVRYAPRRRRRRRVRSRRRLPLLRHHEGRLRCPRRPGGAARSSRGPRERDAEARSECGRHAPSPLMICAGGGRCAMSGALDASRPRESDYGRLIRELGGRGTGAGGTESIARGAPRPPVLRRSSDRPAHAGTRAWRALMFLWPGQAMRKITATAKMTRPTIRGPWRRFARALRARNRNRAASAACATTPIGPGPCPRRSTRRWTNVVPPQDRPDTRGR